MEAVSHRMGTLRRQCAGWAAVALLLFTTGCAAKDVLQVKALTYHNGSWCTLCVGVGDAALGYAVAAERYQSEMDAEGNVTQENIQDGVIGNSISEPGADLLGNLFGAISSALTKLPFWPQGDG